MISTTPQQQQQQIDQLTEAVNILSGKLAAVMAYVAATATPVSELLKSNIQGEAQKIAPTGLISQTAPGLHASRGVDQILWLSGQLQTPQQP